MGNPKVLVTRRVPSEGLDILREKCDVDLWNNDDVMPRASLLERVKGMEGLFCTINDIIDEEVLNAAGRCGQCKDLSIFLVFSPQNGYFRASSYHMIIRRMTSRTV